jgi:hypothetical protein
MYEVERFANPSISGYLLKGHVEFSQMVEIVQNQPGFKDFVV